MIQSNNRIIKAVCRHFCNRIFSILYLKMQMVVTITKSHIRLCTKRLANLNIDRIIEI